MPPINPPENLFDEQSTFQDNEIQGMLLDRKAEERFHREEHQ